MIDLTTLTQLSHNFEIDTFTVLREYIQIRFLSQIYRDQRFTKTYFKGGTCLRLIYGSSRFSEDLDFTTILSIPSLGKVLDDTVEKLVKEFAKLRWKEVESLQGFSAKLYFPVDFAKQELTIKLDFSQRESVIDPVMNAISTVLPIGGTNLVEHLSVQEIGAEKIRAVLHRNKGRDIFDLWYLLNHNLSPDLSIISKKLAYYGEKYAKQKLLEKINSLNEKNMVQDLLRFIPRSERKIVYHLKRLLLLEVEKKL